MFLLYCYYPT